MKAFSYQGRVARVFCFFVFVFFFLINPLLVVVFLSRHNKHSDLKTWKFFSSMKETKVQLHNTNKYWAYQLVQE